MNCDLTSHVACREVLWNVSSPASVVTMYSLFAISMVVFTVGVLSRVFLWASGTPDRSRLRGYWKRFRILWEYAVEQRGTDRRRDARFHTLIFWGFLVLLFTTTMVFLDHDLGIKIYQGEFYLAVTVLSDLFGVALLVGVILAYHRRYLIHPDLLHSTRADAAMLFMLGLMVVQGFGLEGMRIAVTNDPWAIYSPVGYLVALGIWSLTPEVISALHFALWWFHTITVFVFIALLPYTKFLHIISSSANLFFREIERPKGEVRYPGDIEKLLESAAESSTGEFAIGVQSVTDLTWKQRLDLDACTACGRCQDACPAYNSGKVLSPKWLILDTRDHLLALQARDKLAPKNGGAGGFFRRIDRSLLRYFFPRPLPGLNGEYTGVDLATFEKRKAENPLVQRSAKEIGERPEAKIGGEVLEQDVFWACTTCRACMEACPVGIEHLDLIFDVRRSLALMEGTLPGEAQASLRAIETRGNPFGPPESRAEWAAGLNVRVVKPGDAIDVLYWVGCVSAYDKRKQSIVRSVSQILNAAGVAWGILGNAERCTGDPARRLGEENLFQTMAKQNVETLNSISFKTLIANCPHCFNTIKNEYGTVAPLALPNGTRILHHSEFLQELLATGKVKLSKSLDREFTFHDPCYLGRYNDRYDEPRDVLVQLGGKALRESERSREKGMCCGAGGGHFWMDMKVGERVNTIRVNQLAETGADTVATACPFCLHMLEDGVKLTDRESTLRVKDIAELMAEAL